MTDPDPQARTNALTRILPKIAEVGATSDVLPHL
ncbi:hypothetical protein FHU30_004607 [Actinomadura rupiterrae]|nr:hypothetical protein [Actinomadura rupiterrae]